MATEDPETCAVDEIPAADGFVRGTAEDELTGADDTVDLSTMGFSLTTLTKVKLNDFGNDN